jgi:hypothetical protein
MTPADFKKIDAFFDVGELTIYASMSGAWRWMASSGRAALQATVIDPLSLGESAVDLNAPEDAPIAAVRRKIKKKFEESRLVRWLTRETLKSPVKETSPNGFSGEDTIAFAEFTGMDVAEWALLGLRPALTAAEIRHFEHAHNAALSDIESAFLPDRLDLPPQLAAFYIGYLTRARRDAEAALFIAQSTGSTRLPMLCADALAVCAFEGAIRQTIRIEGNDYALSAASDTSAIIDKTLEIARQRLAIPIDHGDHLLRLNTLEVSQLASEIVDAVSLPPFPFLMKAKELYTARADVCRFPPMDRFVTAIRENDLSSEEGWVQRIALAYGRLFAADLGETMKEGRGPLGNRILAFSS